MALDTYANLQTAIQNWVDDSSVSTYAADFITLAESVIKTRVRIHQMLSRETASTSTTVPFLALPTGFVEMVNLHFAEDPLWTITQLSPEALNDYYTSTDAKPGYFAVVGSELKFSCVTDAAYTAEMLFYKFSALSNSNTSNVVLANYPSIYLEESKRQAAKFLKDDDELNRATLALDGDGVRPGLYDLVRQAEKKKQFSRMKLSVMPRGRTP